MKLILIFLIAAFCYGQGTVTVGGGSGTIRNGATNPASCTAGKELFINTASTPVLKLCTAPDTWSDVGVLGAGTGDVLGAASLVSPGLVPYIASLGTLGSDSGLAFNTTTKSLGVFGPITSGQTSTYLGKLVLNGITSGTVTVQPADAAGTWTMTLPTSGGTNGYVLTTDGNGVTSWAAGGGGSGGASAGASFTTQTSVTITHNWNTLYYTTGCADSSGVTVTPATTTIGLNTAVFTFDPALTGTCAATTGGGTGGAVSSVFGRTGAVVAATNDYAFTDISGTLAVNKGGTGATTAAAARVALLNSYSGNGSKCLALNSGATDTEWATCGSGGGGGGAVYPIVFTGQTTLTVTAATHGLGTTPIPAGGCRRSSDGEWPEGWKFTTNGSGDITIEPAAGAAFTGTCFAAGTAGGNLVLTDPALVPTRITGTASLSFSTFGGTGNCEEQNITVAGAASGDVPTVSLYNTFPAGIILGAVYVSTTNTVTVKLCRLAGANTISNQTFNAQIVRGM